MGQAAFLLRLIDVVCRVSTFFLLSTPGCWVSCVLRPAWLSASASTFAVPFFRVDRSSRLARTATATGLHALGEELRGEFPLLRDMSNVVPFDNAATTHKPQSVLDAEARVYRQLNANVHRGAYSLATAATNEMEEVREKVARFVGGSAEEVVFTSGATGALNSVARGFGDANISAGDEVLISVAEHHANLVPWQQLCERTGARLRFIPLCPQTRRLDFSSGVASLNPKCKVISLALNSNVLGSHSDASKVQRGKHAEAWDLAKFVRHAKKTLPDVLVVVDAAQAIAHRKIDVKKLQVDAICCSGHKMYGSSGVGFFWASSKLLSRMQPVNFGGEMVENVSLEKSFFAKPPRSLEAGTPPLAQIAGLGAAIDFLTRVGLDRIEEEETRLCRELLDAVQALPRTRLLSVDPWDGSATDSALKSLGRRELKPPGKDSSESFDCCAATACPIASFLVEGISPFDLAFFADLDSNIHLRAGHHCAQPLHCEGLGVSGSLRASLAVYNSSQDIQKFYRGMTDTIRRLDSVAARSQTAISLSEEPTH